MSIAASSLTTGDELADTMARLLTQLVERLGRAGLLETYAAGCVGGRRRGSKAGRGACWGFCAATRARARSFCLSSSKATEDRGRLFTGHSSSTRPAWRGTGLP